MSHRMVWFTRFVALVVLALVPFAAGSVAAHPAGLPPSQATATLTGQVRSANNQPLAGVRLAAFTQPGTTIDRQPAASIQTDAEGRYSVSVPAGPIWMNVLTQDISGQSFWGYDREPVNVVAGTTLADQDFVIAIRVVSVPAPPTVAPPAPTPVPPTPAPTAVVEPVGMPASGQPGPVPAWPLLLLAGLIGTGLVLRRAAR